MGVSDAFLTGIIEGFYGRSWPWPVRRRYAHFLSDLGLNTYLYCPKGDAFLRKRWRDPWPESEFGEIARMGGSFQQENIFWGVGLSPFELYLGYGAKERDLLYAKVQSIGALEAPLMAVLFDDMPGALDSLSARQAEIVTDIAHWLPETRLLVCPTYYTFDPVLEKHFGIRPEGYWSELGSALPAEVDIFWTGNEVCSASISVEDIRHITDQLARPVMLWDNYPVNDGAVRSNHLYTRPLHSRADEIGGELSGHLCNPMNQAYASLLSLTGLARLYSGERSRSSLIEASLGESTVACLRRDQGRFEYDGLSGMGPAVCAQLAQEYAALPGEAAAEVAAWLRGEYAFDPACLTD